MLTIETEKLLDTISKAQKDFLVTRDKMLHHKWGKLPPCDGSGAKCLLDFHSYSHAISRTTSVLATYFKGEQIRTTPFKSEQIGEDPFELTPFGELGLRRLGEATRNFCELSMIDLSEHEDSIRANMVVLEKCEGVLTFPLTQHKDSFIEICLCGYQLCDMARSGLKDTPNQGKYSHTLALAQAAIMRDYLRFKDIYSVLISRRNEITIQNYGTYRIEDSSARPDARTTPWPSLRQDHLRRG